MTVRRAQASFFKVVGAAVCLVSCIVHFSVTPAIGASQKITIVYTGQTHAALYPCHCPIEPDGGLSRRATFLKELRKKDPYSIVLDAGSVFAGGVFDEYTKNPDLDTRRSTVTLKAMEAMRYSALAIGADEFNLGYDFLRKAIADSRLDFLSCNIKVEKAKPYIVLEVEGVRIGVIGVTNPAVKEKIAGRVETVDPIAGASEAVAGVKKLGVQVVVVLSSLDKDDVKDLLATVSGIDIFINANSKNRDMPESSVFGSTLMLNSSWQGRAMGELILDVENGKIKSRSSRMVRLSSDLSDDKDVKAMVPQCFSDDGCVKKGWVGTCQDPGTAEAHCAFSAAHPLDLTVITLKGPFVSESKRVIDRLEKQFPGLKVSYLYYPDAKAARLAKELSLNSLPAYLFGKEIEKEDGFLALEKNLEKNGAYFILSPRLSGVSFFLNRQKIKGAIDLFMSLYYPNAAILIQTIKEFNPAFHFLSVSEATKFDISRGDPEKEEQLRAVCVQKYYPQKFWDYVECRAGRINSSWWQECLAGARPDPISSCARSGEGVNLLKDNLSLGQELKITNGPVYLIDNQDIYASGKQVPKKEEFKQLFKR